MTLEDFRKARSAAKRAAILSAALTLFRRDGYARASMEEIARRAEVSTATLYRHVESKAALFEAVAVRALESLETVMTAGEAPPIERLRDLARAYATLLSNPDTRGIVRMLIAETGSGGDLAERFYGSVKSKISQCFADAVTAGMTQGLIEVHDDVDHVAGQLAGMIEHGTLMRGLILGDEVAPADTPEAIASAALETWLARWRNSS